jgi:hypothetical protein
MNTDAYGDALDSAMRTIHEMAVEKEALVAERDALLAQLRENSPLLGEAADRIDALTQDAERWRFALAHCSLDIYKTGRSWAMHFDIAPAPDSRHDINAAISAAMKEQA